jgi:hypothetical protein
MDTNINEKIVKASDVGILYETSKNIVDQLVN